MPDPISSVAEGLAGEKVAGGGLIVALAGIVGGIAATDASVPRLSSSVRADCDPFDLDCYQIDVQQSDPVSVMGGWVPTFWVEMGGVVAGIVASVIACLIILGCVRLARPSQPSSG